MQSTLNLDAAQARRAGISLRGGMAALECETKKLWNTKSETMSYLCQETITYGDVAKSLVGLAVLVAILMVGGLIAGEEVIL